MQKNDKEMKEEVSNQVESSKVVEPKVKETKRDAEVLALFEQDQDDFQEFQDEAYEKNPPEKMDTKQWRQQWDSEDINDEFTQRLQRELRLI